jgi:hypothetical protein
MAAPWLVAEPAGQEGFGVAVKDLLATGRIVEQRYCAQAKGDSLFVVNSIVQVRLLNQAQDTLIVSRRMASHGPFEVAVAQSVASGAAGRLEFSVSSDLDVYPPDVGIPSFGATPTENDFVRLKPGEAFSATSRVSLMGRLGEASDQEHALPVGSKHAVRVTLSTWPYLAMRESEARELQDRWKGFGRLVIGTVTTQFFTLELPMGISPEVCDSK